MAYHGSWNNEADNKKIALRLINELFRVVLNRHLVKAQQK